MYTIIGSDGKQYGPVTAEQLRQWIKEGRASAHTQTRAEGAATWQPLGSIPELASCFGAVPAPSAPPAAPTAPTSGGPVRIPSYLPQAILVTLCCCPLFGILAMFYAAQVNGKLLAGNVAGAMESSHTAKTWCWIAFGFGLAFYIMIVVIWPLLSLFLGKACIFRF